MNGYHIYYQQDKEIDFIEISSQFASALFWKEHFGSIHLYCNSKFLQTISKYKLDSLYDEINVSCLDLLTNKKIISKYWSYPKIFAIHEISKTDTKFCVLDTDLWINNKIYWDETLDFVGFHYETFDLNSKNNPYLHPSKFDDNINEQDWNVNAMNCAFMYFNNAELITKWFEYSEKIINLNKKSYIPKIHKKDSYTLFIEQRSIIYLCKKMNLKYGTLINNIFYSGIKNSKDNLYDIWEPALDLSLEPQKYIKHIWGLKRLYHFLGEKILHQIYEDIYKYFGSLEINYPELYKDNLQEIIKYQTALTLKNKLINNFK